MTTRMDHIAKHLRGLGEAEDYTRLVPLLVTTKTLEDVAKDMGPGWTRKMVEDRFFKVSNRMCLSPGRGRSPMARHQMALIYFGAEPCWCEE